MKRTSKLILVLGLIIGASSAFAQKDEAGVRVGFVNAVGLPTRTDFKIDGKSLKPMGFLVGGFASGFGLSEGAHQFAFSNGACVPAASSIEVKAGSSPLYVVYKVALSQRDGTVKNSLKLTGIPHLPPARGVHFVVFSTLEGKQADLQINGAQVKIEPLKVTPVEGGTLDVGIEGRPPTKFSPREAGNYALVLFDGANSKLQWALVDMAH